MGHHAKKPQKPPLTTKEKLNSIRKARKQKQKEKRARLVIRNLPFQATEENLKEHFEKFGQIKDIKVLKKEDGNLVGCAFIQFNLVQQAKKARHYTNGKPFLGREISVDFALAKDKFEETVKVKKENEVRIKEEPIDPDEGVEVKIDNEDIQEENHNEETQEEDEEKDSEMEEESEEGDGDEEEDVEEIDEPDKNIERKPRFESHDVNEGKTLFIRNVPFTATNEDLKQCMRQFGPIYYALICVDKFTEHSKGTAFVKFIQKEDAEKALAAGTELTLLGNILDCHRALSRNEIQQKYVDKSEIKATPIDSRNLYLLREGVILAGTKAAEGVSASDMAKRLSVERFKTQMMKNLNMFVSNDRLIVHNIPPSWDDQRLLNLFKKHSPKGAVIKQAKIMRNLNDVDAKGVGRSKEFGFVNFAKHEDALAALRTLNNNPKIFSNERRPIVSFAIENRAALNAKQKRLEKSRLKNPLCKDYDPNVVKNDEEKREKLMEKKEKLMKKKKMMMEAKEDENGDYVGITAKPGVQKMRNRFKLNNQAKLHAENLRKQKTKQKLSRKSFVRRKEEFTKQDKQKIKHKKDNDNFSKLESKYKKRLIAPETKKSKWFEDK